ncbi:MAG TPA: Spy/CpxP family protein refolding chaperone [Gemmatimonadaceae bacterium]|nr:Spy/CpxP family protein refolding chaperone [Gemmatimonadaceae bacterium]
MLRIRSLALAAVALAMAGSVAAQQPGARGEGGRQRGAAQGAMRPGHGARAMRELLGGITLTGAQQARVKEIRQRYGSQYQALRDSARPDRERLRSARQSDDSAAVRATRQAMRDERRRAMALMQREADEVRAVLTTDQRKQFDENRAAMRERMQQRMEKDSARGRQGSRGGR